MNFSTNVKIGVLVKNSEWSFGLGLGNESFSSDSDVQTTDIVSLRSGEILIQPTICWKIPICLQIFVVVKIKQIGYG